MNDLLQRSLLTRAVELLKEGDRLHMQATRELATALANLIRVCDESLYEMSYLSKDAKEVHEAARKTLKNTEFFWKGDK